MAVSVTDAPGVCVHVWLEQVRVDMHQVICH